MANGIYTDINSADDFSQMEKNRWRMHRVKVWTEWTMVIEIIEAIYLAFASFLGIAAVPAGLAYIYFLNRKDPKICRRGMLVHIVLMAVVVFVAVYYLIMAFSMKNPSASFLPAGLASLVSSVPAESLSGTEGYEEIMKLITRSLKILASVNLICSAAVTAAPVWMHYKEYEYCQIHEELKSCTGYPHFHPDIALMRAAGEISEKKEHKIQTDTDSAVTNAQLMNRLRDSNVNFNDTDALFAAVTANARPEKRASSSGSDALSRVDAMIADARSDRKFSSSAMRTLTESAGSSVLKTAELFGVRRKTANARAMEELVREADRLRAQKSPGTSNDVSSLTERKISTWDDKPEDIENITELSEL